MANLRILFAVVLYLNAAVLSSGSLYDPHVFPKYGPFFEGWYMRFTDHDNNRTFGVLFGKVVPENPQSASKLVFMGLIYDDHTTSQLMSYNTFPPPSALNLTIRGGHNPTHNPEVAGPADFRWDAGEGYGYIEVTPGGAEVNVTANGVRFEARIGGSVPWDPKHEGPMGWLIHLPYTPLYWFVYSTRSPVISYQWHHLKSGNIIRETTSSGQVHMEKNWGKSFPDAWIWTQGVRPDNVSYALAFGPVKFSIFSIQGHLGGYKNPNKGIDITFRPNNSYMVHNLEACSGFIQVSFTSLTHKVVFHVSAKPTTFSCLYGPMQDGFRKVCAESFKAMAKVTVLKRTGWLGKLVMIDTQSISLSALEFGGKFMCKGMCSV